MKRIFILAMFSSATFAQSPPFPECACPLVNCPPCTHDEGQSFYSEKCGEGGFKTRSCSKPKCVTNNDPKCLAAAPSSPSVSKEAPAKSEDALGRAVGAVKVVKGSVQIVQADGTTKIVSVDQPIHEHDRIITAKDGAALLEMDGGNKVHVLAGTRMTVQEYENSEESKRATFNLLKGKIRNQVKQKYDGKQGRYEVITPGVVAGVRGTDFVVSAGDSLTRFDTLEGTVELSQRIGEKAVRVNKNQSVIYSLDEAYRKPGDWSNSPAQGFFGPIKTMSDSDVTTLARATDLEFDPAKVSKVTTKKVDPIICRKPSGRLNQCSWTCENNPKRAKICMIGKPHVVCVRSRCNANGEWAEPTPLPAAESDRCSSPASTVSECDY
jgi:hypothetical protein